MAIIRMTSTRAIPRLDLPLPPDIKFFDTVSVGRYVRIFYPEPPFDAWNSGMVCSSTIVSSL